MNKTQKIIVWAVAALWVLMAGCDSEQPAPNDVGEDVAPDVGAPNSGDAADVASKLDADAGDPAPQVSNLGGPCITDAYCSTGRCLTGEGFPGGYCTRPEPCAVDSDCGGGTACLLTHVGGICARRCASDSNCRDGYFCREPTDSSFWACAPDVELAGLADGAACQTAEACRGSDCLTGSEWPGGYCTTLGCETNQDCAVGGYDSRCLDRAGEPSEPLCARTCFYHSDCQQGHICQPYTDGRSYCFPEERHERPEGLGDYPFPIICGFAGGGAAPVSIDYHIAWNTVSYMITPMTWDERDLSLNHIALPDGARVSFNTDNAFQRLPSEYLGTINPILMPVTRAFSSQLQHGSHTLEVSSRSGDLCYYLLEESTYGTSIDLNIYFVDVPGIDASSASGNADMGAVLESFKSIYQQAGISLGKVNYHDISGADAQAYAVVRSEDDLAELLSLSQRPAGGYDEALSANIFLVRDMHLDISWSAIGISPSLPGAAGLHGTPASGVVIDSSYLGEQPQSSDGGSVDGNQLLGLTIAHELGHFLGLFHTTEQQYQGYDPVADTPECTSGFPSNCPDLTNFMFPLSGSSHTTMTAGQAHTIKANPLTKD